MRVQERVQCEHGHKAVQSVFVFPTSLLVPLEWTNSTVAYLGDYLTHDGARRVSHNPGGSEAGVEIGETAGEFNRKGNLSDGRVVKIIENL